jgi:adenine C2-methylase RlmN of 23S rRNA A2503 and tRNA A37
LIPLNQIEHGIIPSDNTTFMAFSDKLTRHNITFSVRRSFGQTINAACGQLATSN